MESGPLESGPLESGLLESGLREWRERHVHAQDGVRLYLREYGDPRSPRTPVLCLPGLTRNSADFHKVARRLAAERRVLCPDYRGRGRSEHVRDWRTYAPPSLVGDLLGLLAALNLHRVAIIGTSLGGLLAMGLAVARPTAVAAAVLNDVGPDVNGHGLGRIIEYISADRPQPDWDSAVRHLRETLPDLPLTTEDDWLTFARATYREHPDGRLRFDWDVRLAKTLKGGAGSVPDLWPLFRALTQVPTLAVRGGRSDVLTQATFDRMAEVKPDLMRVTVPGVGHAPSLDEPPCREAIDDLLNVL